MQAALKAVPAVQARKLRVTIHGYVRRPPLRFDPRTLLQISAQLQEDSCSLKHVEAVSHHICKNCCCVPHANLCEHCQAQRSRMCIRSCVPSQPTHRVSNRIEHWVRLLLPPLPFLSGRPIQGTSSRCRALHVSRSDNLHDFKLRVQVILDTWAWAQGLHHGQSPHNVPHLLVVAAVLRSPS